MNPVLAEARRAVTSAADFGRVVVLFGGESAERDVSLVTGRAVLEALLRRGVDAHGLDTTGDWLTEIRQGSFDRAWIALHGRGGEDGAMQAVLGVLGMPFTGSGITGCAIAMDKLATKRILLACDLPTPPFAELGDIDDLRQAAERFGYPLAVKPTREGSSIGVSKVSDSGALASALSLAQSFDCAAMVEPWIEGTELTAAILQGESLPVVSIVADSAFYDYQAKYESDATRYQCPSDLADDAEAAVRDLAARAFQAVGARGWGRVDFVRDAGGTPYVLEVNTVPGMTSHSLVPMAARAAGIDFDELVWRILETSMPAHSASGGEIRHAS